MRNLFWFTFLFTVAVALALFAQFNQSNVVFLYPPWRLDIALNLFVVLLVLLFAVVWFILQALRGVLGMPARAAAYRSQLRMQRSVQALREALENLFAGRFARAERVAREAQAWPDNAEVAALVAARAAQQMREYARRDAWLDQVSSPERAQTRWVSIAEMRIEAGDAAGALQVIGELQASGARHIHIQRLALRAHQQQRNWGEVLRLVRILDKRRALHAVAVSQLRATACEHLLEERRLDAQTLLEFWNGLSADERVLPRVADQAARRLIAAGRPNEARQIVEAALKADWDGRLVRRYGQCVGPGANTLLLVQQVEKWLAERPADADLHFALGCLCLHQRLWGKAQSCLEACIQYAEEPELQSRAHLALARLHESLERTEQAAFHYRACALLNAEE